MMRNNPIDIHCHFFNVKVAFRELLEIGLHLANGNYPYQQNEYRFFFDKEKVVKADLDYLLRYVASFFVTAVQNVEQNFLR
jgi:hypothetical protein